MDSLALNSSTGAAAQKAPETVGEEVNCLASGRRLERHIVPVRSPGRDHCFFADPSLCRFRPWFRPRFRPRFRPWFRPQV